MKKKKKNDSTKIHNELQMEMRVLLAVHVERGCDYFLLFIIILHL